MTKDRWQQIMAEREENHAAYMKDGWMYLDEFLFVIDEYFGIDFQTGVDRRNSDRARTLGIPVKIKVIKKERSDVKAVKAKFRAAKGTVAKPPAKVGNKKAAKKVR
jgi:hypothetical protein